MDRLSPEEHLHDVLPPSHPMQVVYLSHERGDTWTAWTVPVIGWAVLTVRLRTGATALRTLPLVSECGEIAGEGGFASAWEECENVKLVAVIEQGAAPAASIFVAAAEALLAGQVRDAMRRVGFPSVPLADGELVGPGEPAWNAFLRSATLPQLDAVSAALTAWKPPALPRRPSATPRTQGHAAAE